MANATAYLIILFFFIFNMLVITTNEMDIWQDDLVSYDMTDINANIDDGVTDLTNVDDLEAGPTAQINFFEIPGLLLKAFFLMIVAVLTIPFVGVVMLSYGVPVAICTMFEAVNFLLVAFALSQFAANRRISQ